MKKHKNTFAKFCQFIYLSFSNFTKNNLWESAASCSFGFVFSFIPISLIILTLMVWLLKISPGIYTYVMQIAKTIEPVFDVKPYISQIMRTNKFTVLDIFLSFWIIWMARRLFSSIVRAMSKIFRSVSKRKNIFNQLFMFLAEFFLIFVVVIVVLFAFLFNQFFSLPFFDQIKTYLPPLFKINSNVIITALMYSIIFILTVCAYKFLSGTKPRFTLCLFYSLICTASFFVINLFLRKFLNYSNYNFIYGAISTLIIMMFTVFIFFYLFLFCAQMIYVSQFFNILLQSEIYLLPEYDSKNFMGILKRILFINPSVIQTDENTVHCKKDSILYDVGDDSNFVYYLKHGTVCEISEKTIVYFDQGDFFGEVDSILKKSRNSCIKAISDCEIIKIPADEFNNLILQNPRAASKALSKVSSYAASIYGLNSDYML